MRSAYNETWLHNLNVVKEVKQWQKQGIISQPQFAAIKEEYQSNFFHPNLIIRILLFIAALLALSGISGILAMMVSDTGQTSVSILCILYGIGSFFFLEKVFIGSSRHYKSGVTEAVLYHAMGFTIGGVIGITDFDEHMMFISCMLMFSFSAYRYLDLVSTTLALLSFAGFVFYEMYTRGGFAQQIIPIAFIILFAPLYFYFRKKKEHIGADLWLNGLILAESICLLLIYAAGNYLVVRELSVSMMDLYMEEGQDIPFAYLFYFLTVIIPIGYLYFAIRNKDIVLLRVSLVAFAFSVFTFKFYYSTGHHEISLTTGGIVLILIAIYLFRYLKTPKHGYTRENIMSDKWGNVNLEAFIVSQTLGGNKVDVPVPTPAETGGGGSFGGGGASGTF